MDVVTDPTLPVAYWMTTLLLEIRYEDEVNYFVQHQIGYLKHCISFSIRLAVKLQTDFVKKLTLREVVRLTFLFVMGSEMKIIKEPFTYHLAKECSYKEPWRSVKVFGLNRERDRRNV